MRDIKFKLSISFLLVVLMLIIFYPKVDNVDVEYGLRFLDYDAISKGMYLGTDILGRDLLSILLLSLKYSLLTALVSVAVEILIAVFVNIFLSFSNLDRIFLFLVQIFKSIPSILYISCITMFFGRNFLVLGIAIGISRWVPLALLIREGIVKVSSKKYIVNSKLLGADRVWIFRKHILPYVLPQILSKISFSLPQSLFRESTISFLGLGLEYSLGKMILEGFKNIDNSYLFFVPLISFFAVILSLNVLKEYVRRNYVS